MSDNKEYVSHIVENGSVRISEDVICSIAAMAAMDVEGVYGLNTNIGSELAGKLSKKVPGKGIRIAISDDNELSLDCYVVVLYGYSVFEVAKNVQEAVTSVVESTTGHKVRTVNVSISGVSLPKEGKK